MKTHEPEVHAKNMLKSYEESALNDKRWFEQHPDRKFRLRLPGHAEKKMSLPPVEPTWCQVVIVRCLHAEARIRAGTEIKLLPLPDNWALEEALEEAPEDFCQTVWDRATGGKTLQTLVSEKYDKDGGFFLPWLQQYQK